MESPVVVDKPPEYHGGAMDNEVGDSKNYNPLKYYSQYL
jgi:hypothetical protein